MKFKHYRVNGIANMKLTNYQTIVAAHDWPVLLTPEDAAIIKSRMGKSTWDTYSQAMCRDWFAVRAAVQATHDWLQS